MTAADQLLTVKEFAIDERRACASEQWRQTKSQRRLRNNTGRRMHIDEITHCGVYFIQCGSWVKIGWSVNIEGRLEELACSNPQPLRPLGFEPLPGALAPEREIRLHEYFALEHHRGEWFTLSDELWRHIKAHCQPWPTR